MTLAFNSAVEASAIKTHTVRFGDTLFSISKRADIPLTTLRQANPHIRGNLIHVGQKLNLPEQWDSANSADSSATAKTQTPTTQTPATQTPTVSQKNIYKVKSGDNLSKIALRHGISLEEMFHANPAYRNGRILHIGAVLNLPTTNTTNADLTIGGGAVGGGPSPRNKSEVRGTVQATNKPPRNVAGGWRWPVAGHKRLSSRYGQRFLFGYWHFHDGIDIPARTGTPIQASRNGRIVESAYKPKAGWGHVVVIEHPDGWRTRYAHLHERFAKVGESVEHGDVIGTVGSTGRSTGPHLHFGVFNKYRSHDPLVLF